MRVVYRVLAFIVCFAVAFQAAMVVWTVAGLGIWVESGGVLDKAVFESEGPPPFPELAGMMLHGMAGMMVIPLIALLLVISSLFAKVPHGRVLALVVLGLVVLQVFLGVMGHGLSLAGLLHGANALLLFTAGLLAFLAARTSISGPPKRGADSVPVRPKKVAAGA